jgi:NAD(P)-dependent dehydrogenase (short-subunit alcohol dehydrogenase family)
MPRCAAEVDSSSIAKSPFIFRFRNGATSHTFRRRHHWWRTEVGQDWIIYDLVIHTPREQRQQRMHNMARLNGKTAVITGGATGIGLAAAKRFIEEGAFVFIFGRRQEALDAAVADLGPNARAVKGSVSDLADLDRLYAAVKAERGTLDIVFANAGVGSQLKLGEITAEHIDETFDINVKGTIFTVQKALPLMGEGGSIILTGSSAGTTGAPAFTAYSASKAAVRNLARTWAEDLKGTGIRVNVLSPGAVATELAKAALGEEGLKAYGSMTALQHMGDPAEVGAAAAFLASSDSSFMTASEVAVDGGLAQL